MPEGSIVVAVDGSAAAQQALAWGIAEAVRLERPLHLLCAREAYIGAMSFDPATAWADPGLEALDTSLTVIEESVAEVHRLAPQLKLTSSRPWGRPVRHLVDASARAWLIVIGSRGRSRLAGSVLGTVSLQTAAHAECPVVVVREGQVSHPAGSMRVVVGVDGSPDSVQAARFAMSVAGVGGQVDLVNAWWLEIVEGAVVTTPDSDRWNEVVAKHEQVLERVLGDLPGEYPGVNVSTHVERGHTEQVILAAAADADLVVVGSRGLGGFSGLLLGSVASHVLGGAPCPVAVMVNRRGE